MKNLNEHLTHYAAFHRDRRNIATHFVGIPMIVFGVTALLGRPAFELAGLPMAPVIPVALASLLFYLALDLRLAMVMIAWFSGATVFGMWTGGLSTGAWLATGLGLFVVGWAIQFIGHIFEGKKPAFVDDLVGLLIGPLFIVTELCFALGLRRELLQSIEDAVGPTHGGAKPDGTPLAGSTNG